MTKLYFSSILLFIFLFGYGQENSNIISITPTNNFTGMSIGMSNNIHSIQFDGTTFKSNNAMFSMGLVYTRKLNDKWEFSAEDNLLLGSIVNNYKHLNTSYSYSINNAIMSIPLTLRYKINDDNEFNGFPDFFHLGPSFSYNLAGSSTRAPQLSKLGASSGYIPFPIFTNPFEYNFKLGTGYNFKLKYVYLRTEFNYYLGFNSHNKNTIPGIVLTRVTNNICGVNLVLENRMGKVVYKKRARLSHNWLKNLIGAKE